MKMLNMDGIQTPVYLSSIDKFEKQNTEISCSISKIETSLPFVHQSLVVNTSIT